MTSATDVSMEKGGEAAEILNTEYIKTYNIPVPDYEFNPDLLINIERKHYMQYIVKLVTANYESLGIDKNIYDLPTAIWRCAKIMETTAAQTSMMVQLYRKSIKTVVNKLKNDIRDGKLNTQLYECLYQSLKCEKSTQTTTSNESDCNCQCNCNRKRKLQKVTVADLNDRNWISEPVDNINITGDKDIFPSSIPKFDAEASYSFHNSIQLTESHINKSQESKETHAKDELQHQMEKLFEGDVNDDLFEGVCDELEYLHDQITPTIKEDSQVISEIHNPIVDAHSTKIKSLDERLESLTGLVNNSRDLHQTPAIKKTKKRGSKWICEEHFLKSKLCELLDHIRDSNRNKLKGIKIMFKNLFGDDSDEDDVISPLDETPEFIWSCKERMAPWVIRLLTPYYIKGRIKGKNLFKSVAKHLMRMIYQCSPYPDEYEVKSFVTFFLKSHKVIRCDADYKDFRIGDIV